MTRLIATALVALGLGWVLTRLLMAVLGRVRMQQVFREQGPEAHKAKSGTLTMGGVGFFLATPAALAVTGGLANRDAAAAVILASACCLIGLSDDLAKFIWKKSEGVKARWRFLLQCALGGALAWYMMRYHSHATVLRMPAGMNPIDIKWLFVPFVIFVFVGTLNSVNFTDGLDGLLGGCTIVVAPAMCVYLVIAGGSGALVPVLVALSGAVAGFLWFNAHPAALFMGDTGSLYIGGLLAAVAVIARAELFLAVAGFLFVFEALSVIIQVVSFKLTGKRVFRMSPIHHHFELSGWAETHVVLRFWLVSAALSGLGLLLFVR